MPTPEYFVAEHLDNAGHYVIDLDENNDPVFSTDYSQAKWSTTESKVQQYINHFEINAKPKNPGLNYPPSVPPLP